MDISSNKIKVLTPSQEEEIINEFKTLICQSEDEYIQIAKTKLDDELLELFVRSRSFKLNSAFERVYRLAFARKKKYPEVFDVFRPKCFQDALDKGIVNVLVNRDPEGRQIIVVRLSEWNPKEVTVEGFFGMILLVGFEMLHQPESQTNGILIVVDLLGLSVEQLRYVTPGILRKYFYIIASASPLKIKGIHLLNAPWIANPAISVVKMCFSQKLRDRIQNHGSSYSSLHKYLSVEILPTWLGGKLAEREANDNKFMDYLFTDERDEYYRKMMDF